jgi:hypothetical protein
MCIDAKTSLTSFIIGITTGLLLAVNEEKEKQMVGLFVLYYSFVQFFEYNIYNNNNVGLNSKLILLNIASQGLILFILIKNICNISNNYIYIGTFVILCTIFLMLYNKVNAASVDTCIQWNFLNKSFGIFLCLMYLSMFYLLFFDEKIQDTKFLNKIGYFYLITFIISEIASKFSDRFPSFWCLSSAVLAPAFLFM